jgi:hypothetical protein
VIADCDDARVRSDTKGLLSHWAVILKLHIGEVVDATVMGVKKGVHKLVDTAFREQI